MGFMIAAAAIALAYRNPAAGYELSIYGSTPILVWIGLGAALLFALINTLSTPSRWLRGGALVLGGFVVLTVVGLPLIRGYYYFGTADALTHLGMAKDLAAGRSSVFDLFYPALHSIAVMISSVGGASIRHSIPIVVLGTVLVFLIFTPLCVYAIIPHEKAIVIGTFGAFLLLPINNISTHLQAHPFSQSILFTSLVLYLWLIYVTERSSSPSAFPPATRIGGLLALTSFALVLFHPQQAANVMVLFIAVAVIQFVYRRFVFESHSIKEHRPMYGQSLFIATAFVGWTARYDVKFNQHFDQIVKTAVGYIVGAPPTAAESVQTHGTSLAAIGSGLPEIFVKLFFVELLFSALAGVLIVAAIMGKLTNPRESGLVRYLSFVVIWMLAIFSLYLVGGISKMYFRHLGFIMLLVTIIGSIALFHAAEISRRQVSVGSFRIAGIAFLLMLVLTSITVHPSPTYYKETPHVTEMHMEGYETTFEIRDDDIPLVGFRNRPARFADAVLGEKNSKLKTQPAPEASLTEIQHQYETPHNLVVSKYTREQEVSAFNELRYTEQGFRSLQDQDGISKVMSNGEVELYHITA